MRKGSAMRIGGFEKNSLIDFPGLISSVVFTRGCNFRCPYCHNPELVDPAGDVSPRFSDTAFTNVPGMVNPIECMAYIQKRRKYLDGVVISGGEPTLQGGLYQFCTDIKSLGLKVKVDTNGSRPDVITHLLRNDLADYIAMDIKTEPDRYSPWITRDLDPRLIRKTIDAILAWGVPHEFRTTCAAPIVDEKAFQVIGGLVRGADRYALQLPGNQKVLDPSFFKRHPAPVSGEELLSYQQILSGFVRDCFIR